MENESTLTDQTDGAVADTADGTVQAEATEIVEELLIEEISIDGMCGVY